MGARLLDGLRGLEGEFGGLATNARGRGLMIAFDLPTPEARNRAQDALLANGLLLLACGPRSIRFRPPLTLTRRRGRRRPRDRAQDPEGAVNR